MASAALTPTGRQYTDSAGVPLAGGSIATFLTGSTSPTPTWSAIAMGSGNLHANPVVLDSAGRATIFILRGLGYRFVVKDSAGVVQETLDGVIVYEDTYTPPTIAQVPTGAIEAYGGTAAPSGWLMCDGAAVSRATYAALFGVIGVAYGVGDNSTTFNVPNIAGRYPFGKAPAAVSTPANPTLATNQSGTDLGAGNYKVAIVGVGPNGAVSLPSSAITQAVGAGGAGRIVVTYVLPTGATTARVYVTTLAGATPDRYFESAASPHNINTLTNAIVGALPTAATTTGDALGEAFGALDHAHLGPSHTHGTVGATESVTTTLTGATEASGTGAVTGTTGTGTASLSGSSSAQSGSGATADYSDTGHTHTAGAALLGPSHSHNVGTLAGATHLHGIGTLTATAEGVRESAAANPPSLTVNWIVKT